jgi:homoserine dehydrogenase
VVGILTSRHGGALDRDGLDLSAALSIAEQGGSLSDLSSSAAPAQVSEFLKASGAQALVETTPVNYESGQPALDYLRAGLQYGMHAITANKGPVVHGYRELSRLAGERHGGSCSIGGHGRSPLFCCGETPPAARISAFAVLNSTTNLILTLMEQDSLSRKP